MNLGRFRDFLKRFECLPSLLRSFPAGWKVFTWGKLLHDTPPVQCVLKLGVLLLPLSVTSCLRASVCSESSWVSVFCPPFPPSQLPTLVSSGHCLLCLYLLLDYHIMPELFTVALFTTPTSDL